MPGGFPEALDNPGRSRVPVARPKRARQWTMRAFDDGFRRAALATALCLAAAAVAAADHESSPSPPESSTQSPPDPPPHFFPRAADVTAVATYALAVDADTSAGAPRAGAHALVTALGTNSVPATVHFASHCGAETFYEGGATLPVDVGPVRSAAAWDGDVALGTAQAPGVVVSGGALTPGVLTLRPGEDVLAAATAGPGPTFLFATWTAPSVVVKLTKDERTGQLVRRGAITLPLGVDYVRAAASRTDASTGRRRSLFATDTSPAVVVEIRDDNLSLASAAVARGAEFVRAGATVPDGTCSYWITHTSPSRVVKMVHDGDETRQFGEAFELDAALGENAAASAVTDERGLLYVGFSSDGGGGGDGDGGGGGRAVASVFEDVSSEDEFRLERIDLAAVDDATALIVAHALGGVARYATRSDPARFVTIQHPGAMRIDTRGGTVSAQGGLTRRERCEIVSTRDQVEELVRGLEGTSRSEASALIVLAGFMCALW